MNWFWGCELALYDLIYNPVRDSGVHENETKRRKKGAEFRHLLKMAALWKGLCYSKTVFLNLCETAARQILFS